MFKWAAEAGRRYIPHSPCHDLPKLRVERSRERHLEEHELRTLWRGLDGANRWGIKTRLAIKFQLATMLRSAELIALHTSEIVDLDGKKPYAKIPLGRVKKRRVIDLPLSSLAVEIIKEALGDRKEGYVFCNPRDSNEPLHRQAAAGILHGRKKDGSAGLCALLGLDLFSPHDLRRTAATMASELGFRSQLIELCLDHQKQTTLTIYDRAEKREKKRPVLDAVADETRRIVADEPAMQRAA
jgi:integrase